VHTGYRRITNGEAERGIALGEDTRAELERGRIGRPLRPGPELELGAYLEAGPFDSDEEAST
jgi:hypothetical protein